MNMKERLIDIMALLLTVLVVLLGVTIMLSIRFNNPVLLAIPTGINLGVLLMLGLESSHDW